MLPSDKVSDAMFKWEKYSKSTGSTKALRLTFKVRLLVVLGGLNTDNYYTCN